MHTIQPQKSSVSPEQEARRALYRLLRQDSTYGSVLLIGLLDIYPKEFLTWDPKTIQLELKDDFGVEIEPDLFDKLMAARQVLTTDTAFQELPAFITLVNALNGDGVDTLRRLVETDRKRMVLDRPKHGTAGRR